jgi:hypothetical protein
MGRAAWQIREMYKGFCWRKLRDHMEELCIDGRFNITLNLKDVRWMVLTGFMWLRISVGGMLL